jgi:hypothetical protein
MNSAQVHDILRSKESFAYTREISRPFGGLDTVLSWCKTELVHDWRWHMAQASSDIAPGRYVFYFDSERDLFAFVLHWA